MADTPKLMVGELTPGPRNQSTHTAGRLTAHIQPQCTRYPHEYWHRTGRGRHGHIYKSWAGTYTLAMVVC